MMMTSEPPPREGRVYFELLATIGGEETHASETKTFARSGWLSQITLSWTCIDPGSLPTTFQSSLPNPLFSKNP